jgi:hypothetical protein
MNEAEVFQIPVLLKAFLVVRTMNILEFQKAVRRGSTSKHEVLYYDYVLSGLRFGVIINLEVLDKVSPFSDTLRLEDKLSHIDSLTFKCGSTLSSGRTILYICPECGDVECGVVSMKMEITEESVIWKDFGIETNLEGIQESWDLRDIEFNKEDYFQAFDNLKKLLRTT